MIPEKKSETVIVLEGQLPSIENQFKVSVERSHIPFGLKTGFIKLTTSKISEVFSWGSERDGNLDTVVDGFVLPRYDPAVFQARLVDVTEQITNELTTLKVHEHVTNTIKNLYPILSRFGMPIVGYDTDKNDQLTPFLDLPSGMGLYASQKEFFCLLGLERYAEELIDLTQETHPIIKDEPNSFWGIYNYSGDAKMYKSYRVFAKNLRYTDHPKPQDEEYTEGTFLKPNVSLKLYTYFDTSPSSLVNGQLKNRGKPSKTFNIPVDLNTMTNDTFDLLRAKIESVALENNVFNNGLSAYATHPTTPQKKIEGYKLIEIVVSEDEQAKKHYIRLDYPVSKSPIYFEVFVNELFSKFLGYENPSKNELLIIEPSQPFYRYRNLGVGEKLYFADIHRIQNILSTQYPLFVCLKTNSTNQQPNLFRHYTSDGGNGGSSGSSGTGNTILGLKKEDNKQYIWGEATKTSTTQKLECRDMAVLAIIHSAVPNDITAIRGYTLDLGSANDPVVENTFFNIEIRDRHFNHVSHPIQIFLTFIISDTP